MLISLISIKTFHLFKFEIIKLNTSNINFFQLAQNYYFFLYFYLCNFNYKINVKLIMYKILLKKKLIQGWS